MKRRFEGAGDDGDGRLERIIGLGQWSMRKSHYPQLRERLAELERFRTLFDQGHDLILLAELPSRLIADANLPACAALGYRRDDLLGLSLDVLLDVETQGIACRNIGATSLETELRCRHGGAIPVDLTCRMADFDGKPSMLLVARDITERIRFQDELRQAKERAEQANLAKSKFLAAASHDLRQPVQAIFYFAAALTKYVTGRGGDIVTELQRALQGLNILLDSLLDVSKLDAGIITPAIGVFPLSSLLTRLEAEQGPAAREKGLDLRVLRSSVLVRSDPALLARILQNLVANAIKYTGRGRVLIGCRRRAGLLRIEVWDTGIGIPADRLDEIFEDFVQIGNPERDRAQGLGLGLAIVDRLARMLGHRIDTCSVLGKGSVFAIEVPLAE